MSCMWAQGPQSCQFSWHSHIEPKLKLPMSTKSPRQPTIQIYRPWKLAMDLIWAQHHHNMPFTLICQNAYQNCQSTWYEHKGIKIAKAQNDPSARFVAGEAQNCLLELTAIQTANLTVHIKLRKSSKTTCLIVRYLVCRFSLLLVPPT